jgi:hypothetical protein
MIVLGVKIHVTSLINTKTTMIVLGE